MIEVKNITKSTKEGRQILKGISFKAKKGDFIGILGPSGAGKTLTMRCLNGLTKPTTGEILITIDNQVHDIAKNKGKELRHMRQKIGVVFQGFNLVKRLSVLENVMIGKLGQINQFRSLFKGFNNEEAQKAYEALEKVKIEKLAKRKVASLSGGEMQRVAIARAIFQEPVILLADEPIANLDPTNAKKIMKRLKPLSEEMPVIGVFHQPEIASKYCNRIIALKDGTVVYDGNSDISEDLLMDIYGDELQEIENQALVSAPLA
ncbi:MAG: phosphonate ABC transporter ATP-binding protein [Bacteroidota bacterium]